MKRKHLWGSVALAVGLVVRLYGKAVNPMMALVWPFEGLGGALRALSLWSAMGNVLAFAAYIALALLPAMWFLSRRIKGIKHPANMIWLALSAYSFFLLYFLINPQLLYALFPGQAADAQALPVLEGIVISVFLALLLCCVLFGWVGRGETQGVLTQLRGLLAVVQLLLLFAVAAFGFSDQIERWPDAQHGVRFYLMVRAACELTPHLALLVMLDAAQDLVNGMRHDWFAEQNIAAAERLSRWGMTLLQTTLWTMLLRNIMELVMARFISDVHTSVDVPLDLMIIACSAVVLARFVGSSCRVKRENELMI